MRAELRMLRAAAADWLIRRLLRWLTLGQLTELIGTVMRLGEWRDERGETCECRACLLGREIETIGRRHETRLPRRPLPTVQIQIVKLK